MVVRLVLLVLIKPRPRGRFVVGGILNATTPRSPGLVAAGRPFGAGRADCEQPVNDLSCHRFSCILAILEIAFSLRPQVGAFLVLRLSIAELIALREDRHDTPE